MGMDIPFNKAFLTGREMDCILEAFANNHLSGGGPFTSRCESWLEGHIGCVRALLTHSCTGALEMAAILADIKPGDEVIMPSYTFVSTANAFVLRGGVPVFVDIRPDTMNMDEALIADAVTEKTRAIVPVHYAGLACDMDIILEVAQRHGLLVIEDAAQGIMADFHGKPLGGIGQMGALSFHETKNITSGEGGALLVNDPALAERAEMIREKGTNRRKFFCGQVDKYSWVDIGSSYLPSEITAAFLWAQMEKAREITARRKALWDQYLEALRPLADEGLLELPVISDGCGHNAHLFYIKLKDQEQRDGFIRYAVGQGVCCVFHYVPLHSSRAGAVFGRFHGQDRFTTRESARLVRLPLFADLRDDDIARIVRVVRKFVEGVY